MLLPERYVGLLLWTVTACVLSGLSGALQYQLSFSISPARFLDLTYAHSAVHPDWPPRVSAAVMGWLAMWRTGLIVGPCLFLSAARASRAAGGSVPRIVMLRGIGIALLILLLSSGLGFALGNVVQSDPTWEIGRLPGYYDDRPSLRIRMLDEAGLLGCVAGTIIASIAVAVDSGRRMGLRPSSDPQSSSALIPPANVD